MFDYSYLNRISSDSTALHLDILEIFLESGSRLKYELSELKQIELRERGVDSIVHLYSNLRILGLHSLLREAELLEVKIHDDSALSDPSLTEQIKIFLDHLERALSQAEKDIQQYKISTKA